MDDGLNANNIPLFGLKSAPHSIYNQYQCHTLPDIRRPTSLLHLHKLLCQIPVYYSPMYYCLDCGYGTKTFIKWGPLEKRNQCLPRALSECQEKAQLLTGTGLCKVVLEALISGACDPGEHVGVLNLSPYDACLEKVCLGWSLDHVGQRMTCVSMSTDVDVATYCEKLVALYLFEARFFPLWLGPIPHDHHIKLNFIKQKYIIVLNFFHSSQHVFN